MEMRLLSAIQRWRVPLRGIVVFSLSALLCSPAWPAEQPLALNAPAKASKHKKHSPSEKSGPAPAIAIPVAPMGFAPPAPFYLGDRMAQASLDFFDEDTLLFTFRVPGLIVREHSASKTGADEPAPDDLGHDERNIRAVVLSLPTGKVTAEAMWRLHDFSRYLWMLRDRHFLLRDGKNIKTGDATLHLEPFLRFPGPVRYLELDPAQRLLVADTVEQPAPEVKQAGQLASGPAAGLDPHSPARPATSTTVMPSWIPDNAAPDREDQRLLRILRMEDGKVLLFTRLENQIVHLPVDGEGYYDAVRGKGFTWLVSYRDFSGSATPILAVESACYPSLDVMAPGVVLASACTEYGGRRLTALTRDKRRLWEMPVLPTRVWPLLTPASSGPRLARATLDVTHPIGPSSPLASDDIRGQTVEVYDLATGRVVLSVQASPILDGGGGFALSPSGKRLAVINAGAIQIYDLPPPPALSGAGSTHP
jgi:hypothetical protein